jgi:hypothetical protein
MKAILGSLAVAIALALASTAVAQEQPNAEEKSTEDLAKAAQNPVANLISVPFQFQSNFGVGPYHQPQGVLNIQPVIPITINDDWNLITRWVTPVIAQPRLSPTNGREFGLGDLNPSFFLSPSKPSDGGIIWGVGPTLLLPTATDQTLGNHRWGAGPSAIAVGIIEVGVMGTIEGYRRCASKCLIRGWDRKALNEIPGGERCLLPPEFFPLAHPNPVAPSAGSGERLWTKHRRRDWNVAFRP